MLKQPAQRSLFAPSIFLLSITLLFLLNHQWADASIPGHAATSPAALPTAATPVLLHKASQEFADIADGRVVWQDARVGPTDIYLWSPTHPDTINLTNSAQWEVYPDLDGDLVVWKDGYQGIGIHGLNIATGLRFTVTVGQSDLSRPRLSQQTVVWADNRRGDRDWNIYGYDLTAQREFTLSDAPGNQADPQIDWPWVVWWDEQERIYAHNLQSGVTQTVQATRGARLPAVSAQDQLVVWQDARNGDWDIYGFDLAHNQEIEIVKAPLDQGFVDIAGGLVAFQTRTASGTWNVALWVGSLNTHFLLDPHPGFQTHPAVAGAQVVWQDSRNHQLDLFTYTWTSTPPPVVPTGLAPPANLQVGAMPNQEIVLQWEDQSADEGGFTLERATGITGTTWVTLAQLPPGTNRYTDRPEREGESYWYRLRAFNKAGTSAYSNESFGTTFRATPTADEQYLMTLINEVRADPAHFGYPDHVPVPPLVYNKLIGYSAHSHSQAILNSAFQFGHCDVIGRCPTERARSVGYAHYCSENLTTSFTTGPAAMRDANLGFLESEGHRHNMLAPDLTEFGVGHTFDPTKGDTRHGQVTEVFCGANVEIPPLPSGAMIAPGVGSSSFTFVVNYYSAQGEAPLLAEVIVDGQSFPLTLRSGKAAHGTYAYNAALEQRANRKYHFRFVYGNGKVAFWPPDAGVTPPAYALYLPFINR